MAVKKGDTVKVDYVGTLEDGSEFDNSIKHGHPLEFEAGSGKVIKGFDEAVIGMEKDEEKDITLQPADAYGDPNPDLVKKIPREQLPKDKVPEVGMMLGIGLPTGQQVPATITEVQEDHIMIDMNPPLAGKVLKFKITVKEISDGKSEPAAVVEKPAEKPEEKSAEKVEEKPAEKVEDKPAEKTETPEKKD